MSITGNWDSNKIFEDTETIALALKTLGEFDFATNTNVKNFDAYLVDLVRDCVVNFLDNDSVVVRKEAALTTAILVGDALSRNHSVVVMSEILEKLLIVGITDR